MSIRHNMREWGEVSSRGRGSTWVGLSTVAVISLLFGPGDAMSPDSGPTFAEDVAPIIQSSCQQCHQEGGMAPMSLVTYEDVRPWAPMIKSKVESRTMPPWHVDKRVGIQEFKNDISLSDDEIGTIVAWAEAGAISADAGVFVQTPRQNSAASKIGLNLGDVILAADGQEIDTYGDLQNIVKETESGGDIHLTVRRNNDVKEGIVMVRP